MKKICGILILTAILAWPGFSHATVTVKVFMDWYPGVHFVPFILAQEFGYYQQEGLKVEIIPGKGAAISAQAVGSGAAEFGLTGAVNVLTAKEQGMRLKVIAGAYQTSSQSLFFRKSSGIKTPQDLKGKSIVSDPKKSTHLQLVSFLRKIGVHDQVKIVSVGGTLYAELSQFLSGRVDAIVGVRYIIKGDNQLLKDMDDVAWFGYADYGLNTIDKVLVTNEKTLNSNPGLVRKFTKIYLKSLEYALSNPRNAARILVKHYPQLKEDVEHASLKESAKYVYGSAGKKAGVGYMSLSDWQRTNKLLIEVNQLTPKSDITGVFTNDFLK